MCDDDQFNEKTSNLTVGPVSQHRWIYSCGKQLLERVLHAYGLQHSLRYTVFRPFNWIGPNLDRIVGPGQGYTRVITEFISKVIYDQNILLVDGGGQKRCFLDVEDGVGALIRIIERDDKRTNRQIFSTCSEGVGLLFAIKPT